MEGGVEGRLCIRCPVNKLMEGELKQEIMTMIIFLSFATHIDSFIFYYKYIVSAEKKLKTTQFLRF